MLRGDGTALVRYDLGSLFKLSLDEKHFRRTGECDVAVLSAYCQRAGLDLRDLESVIELGCGVGRLTIWLSNQVTNVNGVDVSPSHLLIARQRLEKAKITNVRLIQLTALSEIELMPMADLFYPVLVMQHNPPPVIAELLKAFLGRINVGGFALFQVPTYAENYEFIFIVMSRWAKWKCMFYLKRTFLKY